MSEIAMDICKVLLFAAVSFIVLFVFSKLLGKKQIAQLDFVDYAVGISLGSIAADMAFDVDEPWYRFVIAMAVFFLLDMFISFIGRKGPFMKRIFKGKPLVVIYEGKLLPENLKKSKLDVNDLLALCREKGYFDLKQIAYALFETSGQLSIMPIGEERPAVTKDLPIEIQKASLPNYLVIDGRISYSGLNEIDKSREWLFSQLAIQSDDELKQILVASYDDNTQKVDFQKK